MGSCVLYPRDNIQLKDIKRWFLTWYHFTTSSHLSVVSSQSRTCSCTEIDSADFPWFSSIFLPNNVWKTMGFWTGHSWQKKSGWWAGHLRDWVGTGAKLVIWPMQFPQNQTKIPPRKPVGRVDMTESSQKAMVLFFFGCGGREPTFSVCLV